jgi:hypothetical protein
MTDRRTETGSQTERIGPDRRRLDLGSDPGQLIDRIETLRALLPALAQETARPRAVKRHAGGRRTQRYNAASSTWKPGLRSLAIGRAAMLELLAPPATEMPALACPSPRSPSERCG